MSIDEAEKTRDDWASGGEKKMGHPHTRRAPEGGAQARKRYQKAQEATEGGGCRMRDTHACHKTGHPHSRCLP